jgi:fructose-1-phosphate kinase PfkB-like protein
VDNETEAVVNAARTLCESIEIVIVSLGEQGAVAVTKDRALHCKVKKSIHKTVRTVGCGDYLLAGFFGRIQSGPDVSAALAAGTQASAARAWGLTDTMEWTQVTKELDVEITEF